MADVGHGGKEVYGFVYFHLQHFANAFAAPADCQGFWIEACTVAGFARHFDVRQKAHFYSA